MDLPNLTQEPSPGPSVGILGPFLRFSHHAFCLSRRHPLKWINPGSCKLSLHPRFGNNPSSPISNQTWQLEIPFRKTSKWENPRALFGGIFQPCLMTPKGSKDLPPTGLSMPPPSHASPEFPGPQLLRWTWWPRDVGTWRPRRLAWFDHLCHGIVYTMGWFIVGFTTLLIYIGVRIYREGERQMHLHLYWFLHSLLLLFITGWCPPVISGFINPINYSYICHKP